MKKSFMTRALATGLSLAMAFSLTAATNVTTAAAAAKPAMKASKMTVKEGKSKTFLATAKTLKTYKITKAKVKNASAKQYISVKKNAKGTGIVVTGKKGADTARKIVITFQNKKTKKTTNLTTKVVVKAVKQEEEKLTMTASVKGVKTIELDFNKAIVSSAAVKVTVKKGTAARDCKATVDGAKITLAMDAKLTAGTYDVSVEGVDTTAMTASVVVEKDETLTSYEIADYLVAGGINVTTNGSIKYAALNQYGEKMTASEPSVTCSFGKVTKVKAATATAEGEITVEEIPTILGIVGTKGTVVLVAKDTGVTATKEISFNTAATAATAEVVGTYNKNSAALKNISENDTIADYELLFTVKDQYGYAMSADKLNNLNISIVGGLTNIEKDTTGLTTRTLKGVDYVALPLKGGKAVAGDVNVMVVNPYKGLLVNTTISVAKSVVIKSISITADNGVYEDQDNEMAYEIVDADGKSVTGYAELTNSVGLDKRMRFERKSDGSAKLLYNPGTGVVPRQTNTDKATLPQVVTVSANRQTSGDFLLKTFTFTVNQKRFVKGVTGIKSDVTTSTAKGGKTLEIKSTDIILADQYSNKVTSDEKIFDTNMALGKTTGTSVYVAANGAFTYAVNGNKLIATPAAVGTATVYLKYGKDVTASTSDYDAKFNISVFDTTGVDVSTLAIDSINDGFAVQLDANGAVSGSGLTAADVKVVATVGGTKTVIPTSQYVIVKNENNTLSGEDKNKGVDTKTAKLTVQVTTWDSANTPIETLITKEYQVSNAAAKLYKVTDAADATKSVSAGAIVKSSDLVANFTFKDQYGKEVKGNALGATKADSVAYFIEMISATDKSGYTISHNNNEKAQIEFKNAGVYKVKVTANTPDGSSKSYTYTVEVN